MKADTWYYLDPDNNKPSPDVPHCIRCKKPMKQTQSFESFTKVDLHYDSPWVKTNPFGKYLLGSECAKKLEEI